MRVLLTVHGGLAATLGAGRRRPAVDTSRLPAGQAGDLAELVAAARSEQPELSSAATSPAPDAMSYTITVSDGVEPSELRASDVVTGPAFEALLRWLTEHAGEPGGPP